MTPTQTYWKGRPALYRVFDRSGRLIYVGQSINLPQRVSEHRSQSWWWKPLTKKLRVKLHPTVEAAKAAEKVAIQEERPVFNSMGYGDWRDRPYWSPADHKLYYRWYCDAISDLTPEHRQRMIDAAFPERAGRRLWAVA